MVQASFPVWRQVLFFFFFFFFFFFTANLTKRYVESDQQQDLPTIGSDFHLNFARYWQKLLMLSPDYTVIQVYFEP